MRLPVSHTCSTTSVNIPHLRRLESTVPRPPRPSRGSRRTRVSSKPGRWDRAPGRRCWNSGFRAETRLLCLSSAAGVGFHAGALSPDILWLDKGSPDAVYHLGPGRRVFLNGQTAWLAWQGRASWRHVRQRTPHLRSIGASSTTRLGGTRRTEANHGRASD